MTAPIELDAGDGPTLDELHLGLDYLEAVWHHGAWCDPLTMTPLHACIDCRPPEAAPALLLDPAPQAHPQPKGTPP